MKGELAKIDAPGQEGIIVGYETQPGGAWTGDYLCVSLRGFESGAGSAKIWIAKTTHMNDMIEHVFPIKEARNLFRARQRAEHVEKLEQYRAHVKPAQGDEEEDDDDNDDDQDAIISEEEVEVDVERGHAHTSESGARGSDEPPVGEDDRKNTPMPAPPEVLRHLRLGGWFRRLPRVDPATIKAPNVGSKRPKDIHPHVWSGVGQSPQQRELECRAAEARLEMPPDIPSNLLEVLPDEAQLQITEAIVRAHQLLDGALATVTPAIVIDAPPSLSAIREEEIAGKPGHELPCAVVTEVSIREPLFSEIWPEGADANKSLHCRTGVNQRVRQDRRRCKTAIVQDKGSRLHLAL